MKAVRGVREVIPFAPHEVPVRLLWYRDARLPKWSFGYHPEIEMQFVCRGSVVYTVRDKKYVMRPHSLLMIYPNEIHAFSPEYEGAVTDKITVMFKPSLVGLRGGGWIPGYEHCRHLRLSAAEARTFVRIATDLQAEIDRRDTEWMAMSRLMVQELIVLVKRAASHPLQAEIDNPIIGRVLDLIDHRFTEPLTNETLSRAIGLSTSRLMHLFRKHMGLGIKQYILRLRILKARELLTAEPGLKVESVAQAMGFKHVADFNRTFKSLHRMTPAEYRAASDPTGGARRNGERTVGAAPSRNPAGTVLG